MINVKIYKDLYGVVYRFHVSGHAGFSQKGTDIVCSAASILVINAINSIELLTEQKADVKSDEKKGVIDCVLELNDGAVDKTAEIIVKSMVLGLKTLEQHYGRHIKISEEAPK